MLANIERLKRDVERYKQDSDEVIAAHMLAMACFDFESLLRKGLFVYREINRLDEALRSLAFRGELEYTEDLHQAILQTYARWLEPCDRVTKSLEYFEGQGFHVEKADDFRAACAEVRGILTPDDEFFSSEALERLRDDAVESFRRGECEEIEA